MRILFFLLICGFSASGCTRMYNEPEITKGLEFEGIRDVVPPGTDVRMVLSHGMCSGEHGPGWVAKRIDSLAQSVGADPRKALKTVTFPSGVERYDATLIGDQDRTYNITFVVYGRPIDAARDNLDLDSGSGGKQPRRAWANDVAKTTLMNDCLIDAVFYLGPNGDRIRRDVREFWCGYLGGSVTLSTGELDENLKCQIGRRASHSEALVFLIPESLGAKVIFDAYRQVDVSGPVERSQALGPVGGIHLVTNQILLLDQAGIAGDDSRVLTNRGDQGRAGRISPSLESFISDANRGVSISSTDASNVPSTVPVVAYTDPNDVLGYRLLPEGRLGGATFVNVLLSNTGTFVPGAPIVANPIAAHRGAEKQDALFEMILDGSDRISNWSGHMVSR